MGQRLRIVHCLRAPVGGLFRHVLDLASAEADLGHDVGIIADSSSGDSLTARKFSQIAPKLRLGLHLIPMSRHPGLGDLSAAWVTRSIAAGVKADVLHGHGAKGGAYARLAALALKAFGRPVRAYYTPHGGSLHFDPKSIEGRVYLGLERVLARVTDGVIFESAYSERIYRERIGLGTTPARVIPNGLGAADFMTPAPSKMLADFLFVGELRDLKGVDVLLEALAIVNRELPVRAVIVGSGPDGERFQALARDLGLSSRVEFTGALPARAAFDRGRCLVVPSRAESFPYVVLEAAAAGLPIIATDVGGIPEIVHGTTTRLIPPGDASALAAAMLDVVDRPAEARRSAVELKARVASKFTIAAMTANVLAFQAPPAPVPALNLKLTQNRRAIVRRRCDGTGHASDEVT